MDFNIGDNIKVNVGNKELNGLIIEVKEDHLLVIYVGKNSNDSAYAIMDNFDFDGNLLDS